MLTMISRILIIASGGKLCFFKNFIGDIDSDKDILSGFLSAFSDMAKELTAGNMKKFEFHNFTYIYESDDETDSIFVIVTDIYDLEADVRVKLNMMKTEFLKRYHNEIKNWDGNVSKFRDFNEFVDENIFIPPKIIITGEDGVGKSTIMNLFPGELVVKLDQDLNEIIEKRIIVKGIKNIKELSLREIELKELIYKKTQYGSALKSTDIIFIVTNSTSANLGSTNKLVSKLKLLDKKAELYIIANFQDLDDISFEPKKIEKIFAIKTFPLSATQPDGNKKMFSIMSEVLKITFADKEIKMLKGLLRSS